MLPSSARTQSSSVAHLKLPFQPLCRARTDPELEGARLDRVAHVQAGETEVTQRHLEAHGPLFSWLQRCALEALELFDRTGDAADQIAHVELDHLRAGPLTGVLYDRGDHQRIVDPHDPPLDRQVTIVEGGVAESKA